MDAETILGQCVLALDTGVLNKQEYHSRKVKSPGGSYWWWAD